MNDTVPEAKSEPDTPARMEPESEPQTVEEALAIADRRMAEANRTP